ncbi:DsbA family protein [Planotetraspora sp. A-T 1434]|uniref:2-hydroxychromene-2-carboxylate isomerase n=1 Tax=Planotetraspora sp. A-T 1434 TaxID=2979219 RepID=UPI0021C25101|nr:DsbA family protein [Planotetraspora sp. A-T 1434]MCT9933138.1 DsbA family protein [Planotetraspora sp. A-T 1434]
MRPGRGPRVHFSLRSPFSWMAIERLRREIPDAHDVVEFIPFWDPDPETERRLAARGGEFHYQQMSKAKHLYILHDTKRMAARLKLDMRWPVDIDPWWEIPHLAFLRARDLGAEAAFYTEVTEARWTRGENICDPAVITAIEHRCGLDGAGLARTPDDSELRERGVDCLFRAYEDDIFGIPYFRVGRERYWGLDRFDWFLADLLRTLGDRRFDTDTAGGCG